ncbi:MAG: prolyl oligopeptidase family serine peptidase [Cyanobacteria bacterium J06581_3]
MSVEKAIAFDDSLRTPKQWQSPPQEFLSVLHAPQLPWVSDSPTGKHLFLADPVVYPPLAELAAPMHKLAGMRVNPANNGYYGSYGATSPRIVRVADGTEAALNLPETAAVTGVRWTAAGDRLAIIVSQPAHISLWVGDVNGSLHEIEGLALNPLLSNPVRWLPDQKRLLVCCIPERGPAPAPPAIPIGPEILEGSGASARSTYESRNLLETAHDDALFEYYATSELAIVEPVIDPAASDATQVKVISSPAPYFSASFSPDGDYLLVKWLVKPWSHQVGWGRFAEQVEVWDKNYEKVAAIASLPVAENVPVHGVTTGPRSIGWRPTAPHTLFWVEALDGGDPKAEVPHRDRLMRLTAPFTTEPEEIFRAEHRILAGENAWGAEGGLLMLTQRERLRRWQYVWLLDVDAGTSRLWFDLDEDDSYQDPGEPLLRPLPNGCWVLHQKGDAVYFTGQGDTDEGRRPFLDLRSLNSNKSERLFRCDPERFEMSIVFVEDEEHFILRSESETEVPNYYLATLGDAVDAAAGEATRSLTRCPITQFADPTPQLRQIEKRIVRYEREDGVPLSFHLHLPPNYEPGKAVPTVLYAYPDEFSSAKTAGQVRGSAHRFMRLYGPSHLYFLLQGYAVLDQTSMPMLGDPETAYDTFVPQLVADAEAAVRKAVEIGVADPKRVGVIGHSHGGLMVANLMAHTQLFQAGIARSGSYNKTNQPFGFQAERRSLFEARDAYIQLSPTFFADQIKQPILIIHGDADANPGTLTFQSEVFFEAVRGSGGTTRLVLLPFEDHGYRAKESIEHVIWEQLRWFDTYLKGDVAS